MHDRRFDREESLFDWIDRWELERGSCSSERIVSVVIGPNLAQSVAQPHVGNEDVEFLGSMKGRSIPLPGSARGENEHLEGVVAPERIELRRIDPERARPHGKAPRGSPALVDRRSARRKSHGEDFVERLAADCRKKCPRDALGCIAPCRDGRDHVRNRSATRPPELRRVGLDQPVDRELSGRPRRDLADRRRARHAMHLRVELESFQDVDFAACVPGSPDRDRVRSGPQVECDIGVEDRAVRAGAKGDAYARQ